MNVQENLALTVKLINSQFLKQSAILLYDKKVQVTLYFVFCSYTSSCPLRIICPIKSVLFQGEKTMKCSIDCMIQLFNMVSHFDWDNQGLESVLRFAKRYPC